MLSKIYDFMKRFKRANTKPTKYDIMHIKLAKVTSLLSHCKRLQVGAVLVKDHRSIANGYNGRMAGGCNVCEDDVHRCRNCDTVVEKRTYVENYTCECGGREFVPSTRTRNDVIHAEANVLAFCARNGIATEGTAIYITTSPCINCSVMLVNAGVKEVVFMETFRNTEGLKFLKDSNIPYRKVTQDLWLDN